MKKNKNYLPLLSVIFLSASFASCSSDDDSSFQPTEPIVDQYLEETADTITFDHVNVVYYGDDAEAGSDYWEFSFYTEMEIDDLSNPVGPGDILRLSFNATKSENQTINFSLLDGRYTWQTNTSDFNPFKFIWGYEQRIDLPTGVVYQSAGTFYAHLAEGSIDINADLLTEGYFDLKTASDSTVNMQGVLIGSSCMKRYVKFDGKVNLYNRATASVPNSTLQNDIDLSSFTQARLEDQGDNFYLGDQSYRTFILVLAQDNNDISLLTPTGTGDVMQLSFFVDWATDVKNGIPAGKYTMTTLTESNSLNRSDIIPFNMNPGYPNRFTYPTGTWYFGFDKDVMKQYACIKSGTMDVQRDGNAHVISFDMIDLNDKPHHVTGRYVSQTPIPVFNRY